jgi:tetrahydromethanopterin S-methyltransferase subunit B
MEEDTEGPETEVALPSSSNQNIVMGIVMGAAVLLLLVLIITKKFNISGNNMTDPAVAELRKELDAQKKKSDQLRFAGISGDPQALAFQIKNDTDALARLVNSSASDAAALRAAQADASVLAATNAELRIERDQYRINANRAVELQNQLEVARQTSTGMISKSEYDQLRTKLEATMAENKNLRNQISEMQNDK